jgi:spore coat protein CotH
MYAGVTCLCISTCIFSTTYTGNVKDSKSGSPVNGVRVSLGYSNYVTTTDDNGNFILSDEVSVRNHKSIFSSEKVDIQCNGGNASLNFFAAPSVQKVGLFLLNGKCIYHKSIQPETSIMKMPPLSGGIYIVRIESKFNTSTSFRINTAVNGNTHALITSLSNTAAKKSGAVVSNEPLLFKHDSYYPQSISQPVTGNTISVTMKPDPRGTIFNETKVYSYNFTITKADSLKMEQDALLENYVPAQFMFNDSSIGQIGIRYKGSDYSLPNCFDDKGTRTDIPVCKKISLKLKFDKYVSTQKFYSMKRLNLHSLSADNTKMHDILSYGLFREMGIISPRSAFVKVYINSVFQGLFLAVEDPDSRFADSRWPEDPDGNMYKEKWPISDKADYYKEGLETNEKAEDSADVSKMVSFYKSINEATTSDFVEKVSHFINLDYFLRYIAVDRAIHNADGMMTWYVTNGWIGNHNYFFYEETTKDGKIWQIPWDLHVTFNKRDPIIDDMGVPDWNVKPQSCEPVKIWGNGVGIPPHCDKLTGMTADLLWNDYVKICEQMLASHFSVVHLTEKLDFYKTLIDTIVRKDPYMDYNLWLSSVNNLRKDIPVLNSSYDDYIHKRSITVDTSGFTQPFTGNGYLVTDRLNNFEFTVSTPPAWSSTFASVNTTQSILHNTTLPLWGTADVKYSFTFRGAPGTGNYLEWSVGGLAFEKETDISNVKEIQINLKADSKRSIGISIFSPEYEKYNVANRYGWIEGITEKDSIRVFKLSQATYPDWDTSNPPDILKNVLTHATGIVFQPNPNFDSAGKLAADPDSGFVQIDNIRFVY